MINKTDTENRCFLILGLMSGTSLDGLDLALCRFEENGNIWNYEVIQADTIPYPLDLKIRLREGVKSSAFQLKKLDIDLACFFANQVNRFIDNKSPKPTYIASHGHTIFHQPKDGITLQIGNGAVIAANTGISVISDFRSSDVALGGEGAPLVPVGDALLFPQYTACLNLGGFSNISFLQQNKRIAFDISPCNLPLNILAKEHGIEFDQNGCLAKEGEIIKEILLSCNSLPYYNQKGPKSLGFEWLQDHFMPIIMKNKENTKDKLRTVVEHIAYQISLVINSLEGKTILTTGGGARNTFLIDQIKKYSSKEIVIPDNETVEYKEAIIFGLLGLLRVLGRTNTLSSVTGASEDSCGGAIYYAKNS